MIPSWLAELWFAYTAGLVVYSLRSNRPPFHVAVDVFSLALALCVLVSVWQRGEAAL